MAARGPGAPCPAPGEGPGGQGAGRKRRSTAHGTSGGRDTRAPRGSPAAASQTRQEQRVLPAGDPAKLSGERSRPNTTPRGSPFIVVSLTRGLDDRMRSGGRGPARWRQVCPLSPASRRLPASVSRPRTPAPCRGGFINSRRGAGHRCVLWCVPRRSFRPARFRGNEERDASHRPC